jgi:hypothetical protein
MRKLVQVTSLMALIIVWAVGARAQPIDDRTLLAEEYPQDTLEQLITPRSEWHPFPTIEDPDALEAVPPRIRQAYIDQGEEALDEEWERLPATLFLEFVRTGNRSRYQALRGDRRERLADLVLAELFEREGRFTDQITNGIWAICEESFWGVPAHLGLQEEGHGLPDVEDPVVDLFAAETGVLLAWTHYLLESELDDIDPLIADRIAYEIDRRILTPYEDHEDWWWMGYTWRQGERGRVNNWNPWINSNVIATTLLMEDDPERRLALIHKAMYSLDAFIKPHPADGGSDEGPSYWNRAGASLFDALDWLHRASDGSIDIYDDPLIRRMGQYIYRVYISDPYFINFADAEAKMRPNASIVYRFGKAIEDRQMMGFGAFIADVMNVGSGTLPGADNLTRLLPALFTVEELVDYPASEPLVRDVWFPDLEVMAARSMEGSSDGFYMAAKGGHNAESHNHNDVGNFLIYHDGDPVLIDAGRQTYTAQTFSPQRYELWNNQSRYHNVPTINAVMQRAGRQYEAREVNYEVSDSRAEFSLDIAGAYPEEAQVEGWHRTLELHRGDRVTVEEAYELSAYEEPFVLNYLTPLEVQDREGGRVHLQNSGTGTTYTLQYDPDRLEVQVETVTIEDEHMQSNWGKELRRIMLVSTTEVLQDAFVIEITSSGPE